VGNPNLVPEKANTLTVGGVFQPNFIPGLYASLDYFDIKMSDQIVALSAQTLVNQCYGVNGQTQNPASCAFIQRSGPAGPILSITLPTENIASSETNGVDIELGYEHPVNVWRFNGGLSFHAYMTYYFKESSTTGPGATPVNAAPGPNRFVMLATEDYKTGPWTFGLQTHFTNGGLRSVTVTTVYPGSTVPGAVWWDLIARRSFQNGKYEGYATVQNLFDKDPPVNYFSGPNSGSASINGDPLGRRFLVGLKIKL
jgi:outer membrane receptor protein involved in Fe transport